MQATAGPAPSRATELRGNLEWVHRFDRNSAGISGSANALGIVLPFSLRPPLTGEGQEGVEEGVEAEGGRWAMGEEGGEGVE